VSRRLTPMCLRNFARQNREGSSKIRERSGFGLFINPFRALGLCVYQLSGARSCVSPHYSHVFKRGVPVSFQVLSACFETGFVLCYCSLLLV
jgi:hypothetical protein